MKWMIAMGAIALGSTSVFAAESIEREAKTSSTPSVAIELDSGFLEVTTWSKNEVRIEGQLDDDVEEWSFDASNDSVDIEIEEDRRDWNRSGGRNQSGRSETRLRLSVPVGTRLAFEGVNASMTASGLSGALEAETVNGDLKISDINGPVGVGTVNGDIEVINVTDTLEAESVNGDIQIARATGDQVEVSAVNGAVNLSTTATDIEVEAVSGDVELDLQQVERLDISLVSGDLGATLQLMDNGRLTANAVSGDIDLFLREPINIRVAAESMSGDLMNAINDVEAEGSRFNFGNSLAFIEGDASARVEVNTVSGDLNLKRAAE